MEPISSSQEFAIAIGEVCARYIAHWEPTADVTLYAVKLDASGPQLNLTYHKNPDQSPYIAFTLQSERGKDEAEGDQRSWLGGKR